MSRIFYIIVVVGSAFLFHFVNGYFSDIREMRNANATMKSDLALLHQHLSDSNQLVASIMKENQRLMDLDRNYHTEMTTMNEQLSMEREEHRNAIEELEKLSFDVCHVPIPDAIRRMQSDRAKQVNRQARDGHNKAD